MRWLKGLVEKKKRRVRRPHFRKRGLAFSNPHLPKRRRSLVTGALWLLGYYRKKANNTPIPKAFVYPNPHEKVDQEKPFITWINHSTYYASLFGLHVLTDPIWNGRCSPSKKMGPRRQHPTPFSLEDLSMVDYILISHNHYDHLDRFTVRALHRAHPHIVWFVPLGVKKWFYQEGIEKVIEMGWWQACSFSPERSPNTNVQMQCVPAQHFSGRYIWDHNRSLWCGWVMKVSCGQESKTLYFAGDTGYNSTQFREIGKRCGPMDASIIPIGAYAPREFMRSVHVCPREAVQIHREVESKLSFASHWKTFRLSNEGMNRPPYDLFLAMEGTGTPLKEFRVLDPGQSQNF